MDVRHELVSQLRPLSSKLCPQVLTIPMAQLRARLNELDRSRPVITVCNVGKTRFEGYSVLCDVSTLWQHIESYSIKHTSFHEIPSFQMQNRFENYLCHYIYLTIRYNKKLLDTLLFCHKYNSYRTRRLRIL